MLKAQVSLYPVDHEEVANLRDLSAQFLDEHALDYDLQPSHTSVDTTITGDDDQVWTALRQLFQTHLQGGHDIVMVTTITHWDVGERA